ncbi:MAG: hypothetical protein AAFQ67_01315 [Pseudomonadota bacterium]
MTALYILALGFLCVSALFLFGWPLVVYGQRAWREFQTQRDIKLMATGLTGLAALVLILPLTNGALISRVDRVERVAEDVSHVSWSN